MVKLRVLIISALCIFNSHAAVLNSIDGSQSRVARSIYIGGPGPSFLPPPPRGPPPPPPPPVFFRTNNWSGLARGDDGTQGVFSGASAAADSLSPASGSAGAYSVASSGSSDNSASAFGGHAGGSCCGNLQSVQNNAGKNEFGQSGGSASFHASKSSQYKEGSFSGSSNGDGSSGQLNSFGNGQSNGFGSGQTGSSGDGQFSSISGGSKFRKSFKESHYSYQSNGNKQFDNQGSGLDQNGPTSGVNGAQSQMSSFKSDSSDSTRKNAAEFSQNQGSGFGQAASQGFSGSGGLGGGQAQSATFASGNGVSNGAGFSNEQSAAFTAYGGQLGNNFDAQRQSSTNSQRFYGSGGHSGAKAQSNSFTADSSNNHKAGLIQDQSLQFSANGGQTSNNQGFGGSGARDDSYSHGSFSGNEQQQTSHKDDFGGYHARTSTFDESKSTGLGVEQQQSSGFGTQSTGSGFDQSGFSSALSGALNLASQGLQAQQSGCSTCGKSSLALSNAKSDKGNAIALSIGG